MRTLTPTRPRRASSQRITAGVIASYIHDISGRRQDRGASDRVRRLLDARTGSNRPAIGARA
jgi:hypothetical protein